MKVPFYNDTIWSDRIWAEGNKGWFVLAGRNSLFEMDLRTKECKLLTVLPDFISWRSNPTCIKYKNHIFCMPAHSKNMWDYDMESGKVESINILQDDTQDAEIYHYWIVEDIMYAVSNSWKQIIVVDLQKRKVMERVPVADENIILGRSVLVENSIYMVSQSDPIVYEYNMDEQIVTEHVLNNIDSKFYTIVYDGNNFWLSGTCKEIYIWNKSVNTVNVIKDFPDDFGKYLLGQNVENVLDCQLYDFGDPVFTYSVNSAKYVWFIPYKANKILYVNKENFQVNVLDIEEEIETKETLSRKKIFDKFFLQYVDNEKLLNLYSEKNKNILEIDMDECIWSYKNVKIDLKNGVCGEKQNLDIIRNNIFTEDEKVFFCSLFFEKNNE